MKTENVSIGDIKNLLDVERELRHALWRYDGERRYTKSLNRPTIEELYFKVYQSAYPVKPAPKNPGRTERPLTKEEEEFCYRFIEAAQRGNPIMETCARQKPGDKTTEQAANFLQDCLNDIGLLPDGSLSIKQWQLFDIIREAADEYKRRGLLF